MTGRLALVLVATGVTALAGESYGEQGRMEVKELRGEFEKPGSEFRGKPFWALNGVLKEGELRRQLGVFQEMGLGGGFLHSRVGLGTPYLSAEWFKLMNACADECRKRKMEAWLYDEDRWPSGAAGGLVTKDPRYRMRYITMKTEVLGNYRPDGRELGLFTARLDGRTATGVKRVTAEELRGLKEGGVLLVFRETVDQPSPWYNDQTYLDTLSHEAVQKFISVTHDAYAKAMKKDFGRIVPGIFTDEPNYGHGGAGSGPWTGKLPEVFRKRYGYDIMEHLPELFLLVDKAEFSAVRRDYRDCVTHLFVDAFSRQIGEWCDRNGIMFTGHVLSEENLWSQTAVVGAAMRFYEYMQAPGIDILTGQGLEREGGRRPEFATAKQTASMLRQCGRKWMLSEIYGCTGWQFTFAEYKAVGDWQAAMGVNLRCPHLAWYTARGEAKRDYPASISFQSPWWKEFSQVEDYFSRVNVLLTRGEPVRDVAVIHPIESAWGLFTGGDSPAIWDLNGKFEKLEDALLESHFDFDYVDEEFASRKGGVEGSEMAVGLARYRAVVVPPMLTIRKTTLDLLGRFAAAGGRVVWMAPTATLVDGKPAEGAKEARPVASPAASPAEVVKALEVAGERLRRASITGPDGSENPHVLYMLRTEGDGRAIVFICNRKQTDGQAPLKVRVPFEGQVAEWDAVTGKVYAADATQEGGTTVIRTGLPAYGSRLFVIDKAGKEALPARPSLREVRRGEPGARSWTVSRNEPNAFPLDIPEVLIDGKSVGRKEILQADQAVRTAAGLRHRGGAMVQPWADTTPDTAARVQVGLKYRFKVEKVPQGTCHLVMEDPRLFKAKLNGKSLNTSGDAGWWIDPSFRRVKVPASLLKRGANELVLETSYGPKSGLECIYMTGEFGVRVDGAEAVMTALPGRLDAGDWRSQGFPFYTGAMIYILDADIQRAGERVVIEVPEWDGVLLRFRVNGKDAGRVAWPPFEVDITEKVKKGRNRVEVTVFGSRRNLLGPLHHGVVYPSWTGPWEYLAREHWRDDYVGVPYGLKAAPAISFRKPG